MLLSQVQKRTGLTRKAIEYYLDQGLIAPETLNNGYREFSEEDAARLEAIAAYRKLGVSVAEIREILSGDARQALKAVCVRRAMCAQREQRKDELLRRLASGAEIGDIAAPLRALEAGDTIADRLLGAFPGYFGQYLGLHFSQFLGEPIETDAQREAFETIIAWLDALTPPELDDDLKAFLDEATRAIGAQEMGDMIASVRDAVEQPEQFFRSHEETIRTYLAIKETEAYRASPAARLTEQMKRIQQENGYLDVFIPAMERLSPAYAIYRERLEAANAAMLRILSP